MLFQVLKMSVYFVLIFIAIQGILSIKSQVSKNKRKEQFSDTEPTEEDEDESPEEPTEASSVETIASENVDAPPGNYEEMLNELTTTIQTNFDTLKENMDNQMDTAKKMVNDSVKKVFKMKQEYMDEVVELTPSDDAVQSEEDTESQVNEEEASDDEEEDTFFSEGFVEEGMYDGITSPYCLNCSSI
tara:strand:+ start:33 stop:593 length:561 start_codon:yes stop_codon:yes gene_type:complete